MATADRRAIRNPVVRFEVAQHTVVDGSVVAINSACPANCRMVGHTLVASNVTNGITYTLKILGPDSEELYTVAAIAENATTFTSLTRDNDVFIPDGSSVTITPSGDPGSAGTVDVRLFGV